MLPHPHARTRRERLTMAKKKAENSKATVAKAAKEDRANAKERANAKAAEDAYWEAAGDGARSKSAAKKEQQVSTSSCRCFLFLPFFPMPEVSSDTMERVQIKREAKERAERRELRWWS